MPRRRLLRALVLVLAFAGGSCGNGSSGLDIGTETLLGSIVLNEPGACGGPGYPLPAQPPFSGAVLDASGATLADLQLGCAYAGGPTGGVSIAMSLRAEQERDHGTLYKLVGSAEPGPVGCTLGPLATSTCLGGARAGQRCGSDADCVTPGSLASCEPDTRCFVAPPTQIDAGAIPDAPISTCIVRSVDSDLTGTLDVATGELEWSQDLSTRVYLSQCPQCVAGACDAGKNAGGPCAPSEGGTTSVDCPPDPADFFVRVPVTSRNSTGETRLVADALGRFCERQTTVGAFGLADARTIVQRGTPAGDLRDLEPHAFVTVGTGCVPLSDNDVANRVGRLPYPLTYSVSATLQLQVAPSRE